MLRKLDLHHLLFLHFHLCWVQPTPCHTCNLSILLYFCSPRVFPHHPSHPLHICILYNLRYHSSRGRILRIPPRGGNLSRRVLRFTGKRGRLFRFFFTSSSPLLFFNYSLQPRYSDLFSALLPFIAPLLATLPVCFRRKQARGKSLPLKVRSSSARETLLDRRIHARECKKFDGSWMLRQQGKSITRTVERCCWPRLNTPITRIDSYKSINTFHSINNFGKMIWPPCSELAQRNAVYSIEVKKKKRNKKRRKV